MRKGLRDHRLWTVLVAALLFRIAYSFLVWTPIMKAPDESLAKMYVRSAYLVAAGHGYAQALPGSPSYHDVEALREEVTFGDVVTSAAAATISGDGIYPETLHPPGWSLTAVVLHRLFRVPVWFAMQFVGVLLDTLAAALVYVVVLFGFRDRRIAFTSGLIYAFFPPLAFHAVAMEPIGIMSFFAILATVLAIASARASVPKRRYTYLFLCGLSIGLGAYFRSDILLLGPFFAIGFAVASRNWLSAGLNGAVILLFSVLTLLPWTYHNKQVIDKWMFTSSALGVNLVNGLGEYPNPWNLGGSDRDRYEDARKAGLPHAFHPNADTLFKRMFWESVREHPVAFARTIARRSIEQPIATPYDWGFETPDRGAGLSSLRAEGRLLESIPYVLERYWSRILSALFMFTCLLATCFAVVKTWRSNCVLLLIVAPAFYMTASHIPIHLEPRYLLPGAFGLFIGFAWTLIFLLDRTKRASEVHELSTT